jgi:hypothetical protein
VAQRNEANQDKDRKSTLDLSLSGNDNLKPRNQERKFDGNEMIRLYEANQNKDRKSNIVIAQPGQEIG